MGESKLTNPYKDRPQIGISRCLLGENVRYNASHKLDNYIKNKLGKFVDFVPICPEVEIGMGTPREAVQLFEINGEVKMISENSKTDFTNEMNDWAAKKALDIKDLNLCGFILKSKSPSCGVFRTRLYRDNKPPSLNYSGLFTQALKKELPQLLIEEEGRMHDDVIRDNFIERIFINHSWSKLLEVPTVSKFIKFHESLKYTIMSHSPKLQKELGHIVASVNKNRLKEALDTYYKLLIVCLGNYANIKSHRNVLDHIAGYFKNDISNDEKKEIKRLIENYYDGFTPLIVPITILNHYKNKYNKEYLMNQVYLDPHPLELLLRNHI